MSIDWSKAPEGTTHYHIAEDINPWRKIEGTVAYEHYRGKWLRVNSFNEGCMPGYYVPIPRETWDGQGLPPVGTVCEYRCHDSCEPNDWTAVHVLAHAAHGSDTAMLLAEDDNGEPGTMYGRIWVPGTCRPIRTPEQIAAEERAAAIAEMMKDAGITESAFAHDPEAEVWAAALHDSGYRRQEEGK
ncbi:hypothetical protein ACLBSY_30020 [Pseudomonas aeruginosa]|uniref:hypothetical protein n=1 Tax=Pseudomonas aeruginosa TaxID=287 RepID=UPI0039686251